MSTHDYFMGRSLSPYLKRIVRSQRKLHALDDMRPKYLRSAILGIFKEAEE